MLPPGRCTRSSNSTRRRSRAARHSKRSRRASSKQSGGCFPASLRKRRSECQAFAAPLALVCLSRSYSALLHVRAPPAPPPDTWGPTQAHTHVHIEMHAHTSADTRTQPSTALPRRLLHSHPQPRAAQDPQRQARRAQRAICFARRVAAARVRGRPSGPQHRGAGGRGPAGAHRGAFFGAPRSAWCRRRDLRAAIISCG